jgi:hypothetical protein
LTNPSLALKQAVLSEKGSENRLNGKQPIFQAEDGLEWVKAIGVHTLTLTLPSEIFR